MFEKMLAKMMKKEDNEVSRDEVADLLKVNPELLDEFEKAYKANSFEDDNDNFFNMSAKEAKEMKTHPPTILLRKMLEVGDFFHK